MAPEVSWYGLFVMISQLVISEGEVGCAQGIVALTDFGCGPWLELERILTGLKSREGVSLYSKFSKFIWENQNLKYIRF